jgi:zinc transport system substrate-binding protein
MRATARFSVSMFLVVTCIVVAGCRDGGVSGRTPDVVVTNSYLQCAVQDLWGPDARILCLAPPGMCPGHFDISPAQVKAMRACRFLLLFDFQQQVESSLARLKQGGLKVVLIQSPEGLCVPNSYLAVCRQVCRCLSQEYPQRSDEFARRLAGIEERLAALSAEQQGRVRESNLVSAAVLVSSHQAKFAQWLGLTPVATFIGTDVETAAHIDSCLEKAAGCDVRLVIANQQEGTSLAHALADRLKAEAVVFSSFPLETAGEAGFDTLVRANVQALVEAAP